MSAPAWLPGGGVSIKPRVLSRRQESCTEVTCIRCYAPICQKTFTRDGFISHFALLCGATTTISGSQREEHPHTHTPDTHTHPRGLFLVCFSSPLVMTHVLRSEGRLSKPPRPPPAPLRPGCQKAAFVFTHTRRTLVIVGTGSLSSPRLSSSPAAKEATKLS